MLLFDDLLAQSKITTIESVQAEADSMETGGYGDDGFWRLAQDKAGNGFAEIRFLPTPPGEKSPFALYYSHYFKGPTGKIYNERSLTSFGEKDPIGENNSYLWNTGYESDKEVARSRSRKKNYVFNILVVRDPAKPENEGKIFKYRAGKKIYEKVIAAMKPAYDGDEPINPFSLLKDGANFRLRVKKVSSFPNYDDSSFANKDALYGGDMDKMRRVFEGQTLASLAEELDPKNFKLFDELKKRFLEVIDETAPTTGRAEDKVGEEPRRETRREDPPFIAEKTKAKEPEPDADGEDDLEFFRRMSAGK